MGKGCPILVHFHCLAYLALTLFHREGVCYRSGDLTHLLTHILYHLLVLRKELFEVAQNKGDEGLAVVDFQAGVFEAMRSLMMSLLMKHYNAVVLNEPVIEVMGPESKEVETRVMIDISVTLNEKEHKMKIKVYNTMCRMDFQAIREDIYKTHAHLKDFTVGKFFATEIVPDIFNK